MNTDVLRWCMYVSNEEGRKNNQECDEIIQVTSFSSLLPKKDQYNVKR